MNMKMVTSMREKSKIQLKMEKVFTNIPTMKNMKENFLMILNMDKENTSIKMALYMKASG